MVHNGFRARVRSAFCDPWAPMVSVFGGGVSWALGNPGSTSVIAAGAMFGTAVSVSMLTRQARVTGARQRELVALFDEHVGSLRGVRTDALPAVVQAKADEAVAAADIARPSVLQMASACDALDEAIAAARAVSGRGEHAVESIGRTVGRMKARRSGVLGRLEAATDEVATVYTGLLELSATARTIGMALDDSEVAAVNDSVTLLQMTFAELEVEALAPDPHG